VSRPRRLPDMPQDHFWYSVLLEAESTLWSECKSWRVERGRCVKLTTSPTSLSRLSTQGGILNISQPYRLPRSFTGKVLLFYIVTCSTEGRRCYATLFSLLGNRGRMVPWIHSPLGIVALHGNQQ
jgi:hypothetical protein